MTWVTSAEPHAVLVVTDLDEIPKVCPVCGSPMGGVIKTLPGVVCYGCEGFLQHSVMIIANWVCKRACMGKGVT